MGADSVIYIRADGNTEIATGHLVRRLSIARALKSRLQVQLLRILMVSPSPSSFPIRKARLYSVAFSTVRKNFRFVFLKLPGMMIRKGNCRNYSHLLTSASLPMSTHRLPAGLSPRFPAQLSLLLLSRSYWWIPTL